MPCTDRLNLFLGQFFLILIANNTSGMTNLTETTNSMLWTSQRIYG